MSEWVSFAIRTSRNNFVYSYFVLVSVFFGLYFSFLCVVLTKQIVQYGCHVLRP